MQNLPGSLMPSTPCSKDLQTDTIWTHPDTWRHQGLEIRRIGNKNPEALLRQWQEVQEEFKVVLTYIGSLKLAWSTQNKE